MERFIERSMYASRWLLAPIYFGLSLALVALAVKFFQELIHVAPVLIEIKESDLVLTVLALVDMALIGGLLVMVMFSGYENFVSKMETDGLEKLDWMGKLDASTLKQKVAASIVAISSIHLLQKFIGADEIYKEHGPETGASLLTWYVIIHMTFVISAFVMGYLDKMSKSSH